MYKIVICKISTSKIYEKLTYGQNKTLYYFEYNGYHSRVKEDKNGRVFIKNKHDTWNYEVLLKIKNNYVPYYEIQIKKSPIKIIVIRDYIAYRCIATNYYISQNKKLCQKAMH